MKIQPRSTGHSASFISFIPSLDNHAATHSVLSITGHERGRGVPLQFIAQP